MTTEEMHALFEKHADASHRFDLVETKKSSRPDLHAFLLLEELCPSDEDLISASEHDEIYFSVSPEELAEVVTEDLVLELRRCGVRYDRGLSSMMMYT